MGHLQFCCRVYRWQVDRGCYFLHAHPWSASSWKLRFMKAMREVKGVELYCGDQCCFGQPAKGPDGIFGLARKRSGWLTNSPCVGYALQVRCASKPDGGDKTPLLEQHKHVWLVSGRARATERYPPKLVAAVLKAIRVQLQQDKKREHECFGSRYWTACRRP